MQSTRIKMLYNYFRAKKDLIGMDMCRKFLEMISRRYANHKDLKNTRRNMPQVFFH